MLFNLVYFNIIIKYKIKKEYSLYYLFSIILKYRILYDILISLLYVD